MDNFRLFWYESKRLIFTKKYFAILSLIAVYSTYLMINKTVLGEAYTAPFSEWSFSAYLCSMDILLLPALLLCCTNIYSKKQGSAITVILTSPVSIGRYYFIKTISVLVAFIIIAIPVFANSFAIYSYFFKFTLFQNLIAPTLISLIFPAVFFLGLGIFLGSINVNLLYALIPAAFVSEITNLWSVTNELYSIKINIDGSVPFELPAYVWIIRIALAMLGIILIYVTILKQNKSEF